MVTKHASIVIYLSHILEHLGPDVGAHGSVEQATVEQEERAHFNILVFRTAWLEAFHHETLPRHDLLCCFTCQQVEGKVIA